MKKFGIIGSFLLSSLMADNYLGTEITSNHLQKEKEIVKSYSKNIENPPLPNTHISNKKFKKDDHRYEKEYRNFNYQQEGYYSDEGYYYGYYDNQGYFYNNIFFLYNNLYTHYDRMHHRGYFSPSHRHHRRYRYHSVNNWNRVHAYRDPNQIVYGYYYENHRNYSQNNRAIQLSRENIYRNNAIEEHQHYGHPYLNDRREGYRRDHHNQERDHQNRHRGRDNQNPRDRADRNHGYSRMHLHHR